MSEREIDKYRTTIYYNEYCRYYRELSTEGSDMDTKFLKDQFDIDRDDIQSLMAADEKLDETKFRRDLQDQEIDDLARKRLGRDLNENELASFKEDYKKNQRQEESIYVNEFNMQQPIEDSEIVSIGNDWGLMPQGIEVDASTKVSEYSQAEWRLNE